ncbi:hypothetical protein VFPPC_17422 [Pochonia chlamydosporia 170]|uniref:Uncharacterized protein n=1 Tax=Pochonia chlamydosporia 170 TaxID=1380566 RepID=A0A219AS57_METCM|nr:hypothetical protein VFPPC_17422 [Pochonia chlamydosporia 170]OWT43429.1 hypothetical protein VFPPC_17422 [Pochonia chlamydosporia 170]
MAPTSLAKALYAKHQQRGWARTRKEALACSRWTPFEFEHQARPAKSKSESGAWERMSNVNNSWQTPARLHVRFDDADELNPAFSLVHERTVQLKLSSSSVNAHWAQNKIISFSEHVSLLIVWISWLSVS